MFTNATRVSIDGDNESRSEGDYVALSRAIVAGGVSRGVNERALLACVASHVD